MPTTAPLSAGIEDRYARRLVKLPSDARRLLLVAAADPVGDPSLVWRAAERLGVLESAAETVESEQLLAPSPRVVFRHPLVRSAVYRAAERMVGSGRVSCHHRDRAMTAHRPHGPPIATRSGAASDRLQNL
ncbi:MAG TPA: hypothetical protein VGI50_02910 [Solirubrobacteraceae bacterium]